MRIQLEMQSLSPKLFSDFYILMILQRNIFCLISPNTSEHSQPKLQNDSFQRSIRYIKFHCSDPHWRKKVASDSHTKKVREKTHKNSSHLYSSLLRRLTQKLTLFSLRERAPRDKVAHYGYILNKEKKRAAEEGKRSYENKKSRERTRKKDV